MSRAAPIRHDETILGTKRTEKREFLLRPDEDINQIIRYVIAVEAEEQEISLHALTGMSNHLHAVYTDPGSKIVEFNRNTHSNIAKAINVLHRESDSLWSQKKTNRVACVIPDAIIDKIAYTMANPVAAFLVEDGIQWPGVRMAWPCEPMTIKRPKFYFRSPKQGGKWPDEVTLKFDRPKGYDHLSDSELAELIAKRTKYQENKARRKAILLGIEFLGPEKVLATSRHEKPKTHEPWFKIAPLVASKDKEARMKRIKDNRVWYGDYVIARDKYVAGDRDVIFPYGTYQLPRHYGARVQPRSP